MIRSDSLCRLDADGRDALLAHGVRTVIDLRMPAEIETEPDPMWSDHRVDYQLIPQQDAELWREFDATARTRAELNAIVLDHRAQRMVEMARAVADAVPGGVLIHCRAGKDRTGLAIALLLGLAGVDDAQIAADYALSAQALAPELNAALALAADANARALLEWAYDARAETMLATLAHLHTRHGGAESYLIRAGLSDEDVDRIRGRLLDEIAGATPA